MPQIIIRPQTPNEEFDFLWHVLKRMPFYIKEGYSAELPDHPEFKKLAEISRISKE